MANNLRMLRDARGWTQEETASAMGTTRDTYVKLERGPDKGGRRLSDKWIERAAKAFGVDSGEIVTDAPPPRSMPTEIGSIFPPMGYARSTLRLDLGAAKFPASPIEQMTMGGT